MTYDVSLCHSDDITNLIRMTYLFQVSYLDDLWSMHHVIRMTYLALVSHPDELWPIHCVIRMTYSSILCDPDDFIEVGISSG